MAKTICYQTVIFLIFFVSAGFYHLPPAWAGELRPFSLPSPRPSAPQVQQNPVQQRAPSETPAVYRYFEKDVKKMGREDRLRLIHHYGKLRTEAYRNGHRVKVRYYDNLLNILYKYQ